MSRIDDLAEAIVFAHEEGVSAVDAGERQAQELEHTAAFAAAALSPPTTPPSSLSSKLAADALKFCAEEQQLGPPERPGFTTPHPRSNGALLAFALGAAAACLVLWLARPGASAPSVAQLRAETIASNVGLRQDWTPGPSPLRGAVKGDVVWRQEHQDGWLTFRDLPELPAGRAYQLWIVDGEREGAPVDGGVFTIDAADEETLVTIRPALPIGAPKAFVVTVEDRGGVVVSKQEHVVAIASL